MKNKDLQRLLSTFPDDLEVCEVGIRQLLPVTDVSERRRAGTGLGYLVLETAPIPTETAEQPEDNPEHQTVTIRP